VNFGLLATAFTRLMFTHQIDLFHTAPGIGVLPTICYKGG